MLLEVMRNSDPFIKISYYLTNHENIRNASDYALWEQEIKQGEIET